MRNKRRKLGFTMAELLIVVAIIGVLAGVAFIAVNRHQRSMAQLERNNIAKEIFVAAQNHLTMAESRGYLAENRDSTYFGTSGTEDGKTFQYIVASGGNHANTILDLMLPFGAIDQTVLSGGSYLIRYQTNPAQVLDVFYCSTSDTTDQFNHTIAESEYDTFMAYKPNSFPTTGYIVGWYGDVALQRSGDYLDAPAIVVDNAEKLTVTITDTNLLDAKKATLTPSLKLIIEGVQSGAKASFLLNSSTGTSTRLLGTKDDTATKERVYTLVLDDITTANMHFADLNTTTDATLNKAGVFIPGEDITVYAVAYSNATLTNIAYSSEWTTNSLFGEISPMTPDDLNTQATGGTVTPPAANAPCVTATIGNFRHLENLDSAISHLDDNDSNGKLNITNALQTADLDWIAFKTAIGDSATVYDADAKAAKAGCYVPVSPSHYNGTAQSVALNYQGQSVTAAANGSYQKGSHAVKNVAVDNDGGDITIAAGGLFGTLTGGSVQNLELVDFSVKLKSGDAGALAGNLSNASSAIEVTNVVAHNSASGTDATITTASGSAGGLVGIATNATISKSAAALVVSNTGTDTDDAAGGLVGASAGGSITGCYSGGHATDAPSGAVLYSDANYNVTAAAGSAGGLVGAAGNTTITGSYSTCSVRGKIAGGFVGAGSGAYTDCYATGLVNLGKDADGHVIVIAETTSGAFAGSYTGTPTPTRCNYFEIVNEFYDAETDGMAYMPPLGNKPYDKTVKALDADTPDETGTVDTTYNGFFDGTATASPYDATLTTYYGGKYPLKSVKALGVDVNEPAGDDGGTGDDEETVGGAGDLSGGESATPTTPADFVATHYGDWPAPEIFVINE